MNNLEDGPSDDARSTKKPLARHETVDVLGIHASVLPARGLALGLFCAGAFLLVLPAAR